jgi:hypothetical protein
VIDEVLFSGLEQVPLFGHRLVRLYRLLFFLTFFCSLSSFYLICIFALTGVKHLEQKMPLRFLGHGFEVLRGFGVRLSNL